MSKILAIDTSTVAASVCILDDDRILGEEYTAYKLKHSEKLLPLIKHLLEDVRLGLDDIDYFAVGSGPGSFTGLRIAASTIKAFSHTMNKPIISVSSLNACAKNLKSMNDVICVIFDAQRNDTYFNVFVKESDNLVPVYEDKILNIDDVITNVSSYEKILFAGDGVFKYKDVIKSKLNDKAFFADDYNMLPKASGVAKVAKGYIQDNINIFSYDNYLPNYIRPSAAEEQRAKNNK